MILYCTLDEAKTELKANTTADDNVMRGYLIEVSRRIDSIMNSRRKRPYFAPWLEQRAIEVEQGIINSRKNTLLLDGPLLDFSEALIDGVDRTAYVDAYPSTARPIRALRLTSQDYSWYDISTSTSWPYVRFVEVTGNWGFHSDYAYAWAERDALAAGIAANVTSVTVADADGVDEFGLTPRFSIGNLIKIDSEYMEVIGIDTATNVLTVIRGAHGSTAAAHLNGAAVSCWRVEDPINRAARRWVSMMYARRGAFEIAQLDMAGTMMYPLDMPAEILHILSEYDYE